MRDSRGSAEAMLRRGGPSRKTETMKRSERIALSTQVFGLLARVVHRIGNEADALLRRDDLNPAQFQLLLAVHRKPGSTQRELGQTLAVTVSNVSMLITKLEAAELLRREARGAAKEVWLTNRGAALVARLNVMI